MAMTDKTGKVVWRADELPFGEEYQTQETPERNDRRFLGKQLDKETGLICMGKRYLDPRTGRFTQPDPVGLVDPATGKVNQEMLLNPQRLNRYVYGLNNPYKYVDPDGDFAIETEEYKSFMSKVRPRVKSAIAKGINIGYSLGTIISEGMIQGAIGRSGRQLRLRRLMNNTKVSSADRGWITQESNAIKRKSINQSGNVKTHIRNPPGKDLAHDRGREAAKGFGYEYSNLQNRDLHKLQHRYDNYGRKNKIRR